nr:hypothetical protein [Tanacetum cinerariifolium]
MVGPSTSNVLYSINNLDVGNPLHMQNSDNSNSTLILFKLLNTKNYTVWSGAMKLALQARNKYGFVDGSTSNVNRGPNPNLNCKHCGKVGHTIDRCFEIVSSSSGFTLAQMQKLLNMINEKPFGSIHANMAVGHPTITHVVNLKLSNNVILYDVLVVPGYCVSLLLGHPVEHVLSVLIKELNISDNTYVPVCEKTCNNDKNLREIQLEHEKEDELVTVVVKVVYKLDCMMMVKEIENELLEEVEVSHFRKKKDMEDEEEDGGGDETRKRRFETERKSWNEMIHHHFPQWYHLTDKMRMDDLKWWRRSYHLIHEVFSCHDPITSFAHNEEREDAGLDHVRCNDQLLTREKQTQHV